MKRLYILLVMALLGGAANAQKAKYPGYEQLPKDSTTQKVTYTAVVPVSNTSKDELFTRGREWFARTFNDANQALKMDDRAGGTLIGNGIVVQPPVEAFSTGNNYHFTLALYVKDGRYKYVLSDISQHFRLSSGTPEIVHPIEFWATHRINKLNNHELEDANAKLSALLQSLAKAMNGQQVGASKSDW